MPQQIPFIGNVTLQSFMLFIFIAIFIFILGALLDLLILKFFKDKIRPVIYKPLSKIVMYGVYVLGFYFAITKIIHFDVPATLTALGIVSGMFLLPAIPILQNIAAGILLSVDRPFSEEDIIEYSNTLCKVKDILLVKTRLRALDGRIITVPNMSFITGMPIINYSRGEFIRISLNTDLTFDSDRKKAVEIIEKICHNDPNILPNLPEKKINKITKLISLPQNFFTSQKNIKTLAPRVYIKNVTKEKVSLEIWFWIWDISLKEKIISNFYSKLIEMFKEANIIFGPK